MRRAMERRAERPMGPPAAAGTFGRPPTVAALPRAAGNRAIARAVGLVPSVQRYGDLANGVVNIDDEGRTIRLASASRVEDLQLNQQALRLDLQESLRDEVSTPEKARDLDQLLIAHACRLGETGQDVIVNCKSGKTRTPVVAIVYFLIKDPNHEIKAAVEKVANAFKAQRPGVGIDYDRKLSGARLLDAEGQVQTDLGNEDRLEKVRQWVARNAGEVPTSAESWRNLRLRAKGELRPHDRQREGPLWAKLDENIAAEDERLRQVRLPPGGGGRRRGPGQLPLRRSARIRANLKPRRSKRIAERARAAGRPVNTATIRRWARDRGLRVADRGRLPEHIIRAYERRRFEGRHLR